MSAAKVFVSTHAAMTYRRFASTILLTNQRYQDYREILVNFYLD